MAITLLDEDARHIPSRIRDRDLLGGAVSGVNDVDYDIIHKGSRGRSYVHRLGIALHIGICVWEIQRLVQGRLYLVHCCRYSRRHCRWTSR